MPKQLGIIGGTGFSQMPGVEVLDQLQIQTPFGQTSDVIVKAELSGSPVYFLARHGQPHKIAPHLINYRANIWALQYVGVEEIIAVNAVGGIHVDFKTSDIVIPTDLIDYTYGRDHTFFDYHLDHIDFTEPYSQSLRNALYEHGLGLFGEKRVHHRGVYACTQGPRLETPAEINRLERDGCDIVGMTGMPETALAQELNMGYACISLVVNPAAGRGDGQITLEEIHRVIEEGMQNVQQIIVEVIKQRR